MELLVLKLYQHASCSLTSEKAYGDGVFELAQKHLIPMKFSLTTAKRKPASKYAPPDSFEGIVDRYTT